MISISRLSVTLGVYGSDTTLSPYGKLIWSELVKIRWLDDEGQRGAALGAIGTCGFVNMVFFSLRSPYLMVGSLKGCLCTLKKVYMSKGGIINTICESYF